VSVPFEQLPDLAQTAWVRLREELVALLGDDLVAIWAHGGTVATEAPRTSADLDTYVIVRRPIDVTTAAAIDGIHDTTADELGVEWDAWYVLEDDARTPEAPRHAFRSERRDTSWAIHRAHWLAGRYALVHGREPADVVPRASWAEVEADLDRELEHLERHVTEGDTDPYEATYAILNGSRILRTLMTRDAAISKRSAGEWALEHLQERWHPALRAAIRTYDGDASVESTELIAQEMATFVAMVRERLPASTARDVDWEPRWSGN
jgi:hypothetical protein